MREGAYQLAGWMLFLLCAGFFIASSIRNRDILSILGSVTFLIACVSFLIPLARQKKVRR